MQHLAIEFLAATTGETQALPEKDRVIVMKAIRGEGVLSGIDMRQARQPIGVATAIEIVGARK